MKISEMLDILEGRSDPEALREMARRDTDDKPTQKEIEDDSYEKGRLLFQGLNIAIENPRGTYRSGVSKDGTSWKTLMHNDYGEILGSKGADGDPVDVFICSKMSSELVYIIDQKVDGKFDEHKVMLGFDNMEDAINAYKAHYDIDWDGIMHTTAASIVDFKEWLKYGDTTKPYHEHAMKVDESMTTASTILNICESLTSIDESVRRKAKAQGKSVENTDPEDILPMPMSQARKGNQPQWLQDVVNQAMEHPKYRRSTLTIDHMGKSFKVSPKGEVSLAG